MLPQWLCGRESLNAMGVRGVLGDDRRAGTRKRSDTLHYHQHYPGNNRALTSILERSKNVLFWVGRILMADGLIFIQN